MFISIPKEFFVPVVFGDGFTLNEENNNLELDLIEKVLVRKAITI